MKTPQDDDSAAAAAAPPPGHLENSKDGYFYEELQGKEENGIPNSEDGDKKPAAVGIPCFVMPILATSIVLGSLAGPVMKTMESDGAAAPLAVATWRHEVSATAMFPFAVWQWSRMSSSERAATLSWNYIATVCVCALGLAVHFGLWVWSLDNTSLTHSLFLCIMSPIFVTLFTLLRGGTVLCTELLAVALGLVGSTILAAGAKAEKDIEFTVLGDLAALSASCGFAVYLMCGKNLRGRVSLFVYLWPVNVMVFIYLALALAFFTEMGGLTTYHDAGLLSWITEGYLMRTLLLGLGPGFLSHLGYNASMGFVKPLVVSVGFSVSPLLGSLIGWTMGLANIPGMLTVLGGAVTMIATVWLSHVSSPEAKEKASSQSASISEEKRPLIPNDEP